MLNNGDRLCRALRWRARSVIRSVPHKNRWQAMKLAEALVLRADIQKRVEELRKRLKESALVQEGEKPPENPEELLAELDRLLNQLVGLRSEERRVGKESRSRRS